MTLRARVAAAFLITSAAARQCYGPAESPRNGSTPFACTEWRGDRWSDAAPYQPLELTYMRGAGFCPGHEATAYLRRIAATLEDMKKRECRGLVVYGVALGAKYLRRWPNRTLLGAQTIKELHKRRPAYLPRRTPRPDYRLR